MADASYDAVIIGGGNKALVLALYLAKYGGKMVDILKPKVVIPNHWDNFWPPISRFEDLNPFLSYMESKHPNIEVKMLNIDENTEIRGK